MAILSMTSIFFFLMLAVSTLALRISSNNTGFDLPLLIHQGSPRRIASENGYDSFVEYDSVASYILIMLGTPPKEYYLHMDTGSSTTWLECQPCILCFINKKYSSKRFNPSTSTTYRRLGCTSQCNPPFHCNPSGYCEYEESFMSGEKTRGEVGMDSISMQPRFYRQRTFVSIPNFIFGCGRWNHINTHWLDHPYQGIAGLGLHDYSFVSQLGVTRFSYCFHDFNYAGSSIIKFGTNAQYNADQSVPMQQHPEYPLAYSVRFFDIIVGIESIPLSPDEDKLVVLDTGTTLTLLTKTLFRNLKLLVDKHLPSPIDPVINEYGTQCYRSSVAADSLPSITFDLGDIEFTLSNKGVYEYTSGSFCLNIKEGDINIIGMKGQIDALIGFDMEEMRISVESIDCIKNQEQAYFNDAHAQRQTIKDFGIIASLNLVRIINKRGDRLPSRQERIGKERPSLRPWPWYI
ncbi:probable aspartic protease At2g35615 [Actinidia eriantha]|uniref:probable aspartic protease At2g35615 n=1 Tax=Actinidia eriantha TaxID=165200 RepID=UPI00258B5EE7|nr:probable aspartic protease At2g35615 [Actinidia eriantha]